MRGRLIVYFHGVPGSSAEIDLFQDMAKVHGVRLVAPDRFTFTPDLTGDDYFHALAMRSEALLRCVARLQGWLARLAPGLLFQMLFGSAQGEDAGLSRDQGFQSMIGRVLKSSLGPGLVGYVRDISAYVQPWSHTLAAVSCETQIWHGDQDNWSPLGMADALRALLPDAASVEVLAGASHYSSLGRAVPRILAAEN